MRLTDMNEFDAVIARAKPIIYTAVARHRTEGLPLTWRLIHSIEDEVLAELNSSKDLQPAYINLIKHSGVFKYPLNDEQVDFGESSAIACAFSMIYEAYHRI
ncbi:hypothetical protein CFter6_1276 [Collimonas fungivorans]|uniref:Uncharacterized protein n=2 Tax=Collimonas fungivorans TaxID=158899 RepID=A0A127P8A8_9BURK|nr:hypothetical protein CFter6_1276 [Collimonas fungivorans]